MNAWTLVISLYAASAPPLDFPSGTGLGETKAIAVQAVVNVQVPSATQVTFPSQAGCEEAARKAAFLGNAVCLEVK